MSLFNNIRIPRFLLPIAGLAAVTLFAGSAHAEKLAIPIGKSITVKAQGVKKIMAIKEGVVEVLNVADDEVIISGVGENPAETQLIIWDDAGRHQYDVETYKEADLIQRKFNTILGDNSVTIEMFPDVVFLKGVVDLPEKVKQAETILSRLVNDRQIVNLITVRQAVTLEQRILDAIKIPTVKITKIMTSSDGAAASANASGSAAATAGAFRIVLEGTVKNQNDYIHMVEVVRGFVDPANTSNLVTIENPTQVTFQAYILQVNKNNTRDLGIEWGGAQSLAAGLTQGTLRFVENISTAYRGDQPAAGAPVDTWPNPLKANNINRFDIIAAQVKAWETSGKVKVLANPKLTVFANAEPTKLAQSGWFKEKAEAETESGIETDAGIAFVNVGQDLYYPSKIDTSGNITYDKAVAALKLMIRDLFVNEDQLKFSVFAKQDEPSFSRGTNAPPDILKRSVMTTVQVKNGSTIVLGGLINTSKSISNKEVPGLSKLPVIGRLFKTQTVDNRENELIILLTPQVMGEELNQAQGKKIEIVPVPRRSERLEELHNLFQQIKNSHFPATDKNDKPEAGR